MAVPILLPSLPTERTNDGGWKESLHEHYANLLQQNAGVDVSDN